MRLRFALMLAALACRPTAPAPTTPPPTTPPADRERTPPAVGTPAPTFTLAALDGADVSLDAARANGPVVIIFASFTCPPSRMKIPGFEALAIAWHGDASFFIVYSREAHPNAQGYERLSMFAGEVAKMDTDGDNAVALAEFRGSRDMFDPFDIDHDEVIHSHELLAARRLGKFTTFAETTSDAERRAAAAQFRKEVPGTIPVLIDPIGEPTARAYGGMPNAAFVVAKDGTIAAAMPWASVRAVEAALVQVTGHDRAKAKRAPNLELIAPQLAAARKSGKQVLVEFSAIGCAACTRMHEQTMKDPEVVRALEGYERVELGLDLDPHWALFESLDLAMTPAFVAIDTDGHLAAQVQGFAAVPQFLGFLRSQ